MNSASPEVLKLEEVPEPQVGPGQVLVKVHAAGVNPYEAYIRAGHYAAVAPPLPFTPGHDAAGVVEAVGPGVSGCGVGDRVYTSATLTGAYAAKALCAESRVTPCRPRCLFSQGAGVFVPYSAAYRALFQRGRAVPGEWVLIHGASGGVGVAAVQLARAQASPSSAPPALTRAAAWPRSRAPTTSWTTTGRATCRRPCRLTQDRGVDLICELLANVNLDRDLEILAPRGRVVVIGSRGTVTIDPRRTMAQESDIRGMTVFGATDQEFKDIHAAVGAGLANGTLKPVVGRELPLAEAAQASPGHHGKKGLRQDRPDPVAVQSGPR